MALRAKGLAGAAVAILPGMLEDVRNYVRAGIGAVASQGADAIPGALVSRAQSLAEQFASFAAGFLEWSGEARASLLTELKLLVAAQIQEMGLASQDDVERLTARVRELEGRMEKGGARATDRGRRSSSTSSRRKSSSATTRTARSGSASGRKRQTSGTPSRRSGSSGKAGSGSGSSRRSSAGRARSG